MSEEKVYTFNEYVLGYDSGGYNDRSCLTISKILNDNMYVMSTLYDGSAEVISTMLDSLQQKVEQLEKENIRQKEVIENLTTMTVCGDKKQIRNTAQYKLEQLENIRKEAIEYIKEDMYGEPNELYGLVDGKHLLNILNKGDNNGK